MAVRKLSVALSETVAGQAAAAASKRGLSLSAWLNESAQNSLRVEAGLAAVAEWELEHGSFSAEELAAADAVIDGKQRRMAS
jgi:hypothetical protein